jgi:hypothetical protein
MRKRCCSVTIPNYPVNITIDASTLLQTTAEAVDSVFVVTICGFLKKLSSNREIDWNFSADLQKPPKANRTGGEMIGTSLGISDGGVEINRRKWINPFDKRHCTAKRKDQCTSGHTFKHFIANSEVRRFGIKSNGFQQSLGKCTAAHKAN